MAICNNKKCSLGECDQPETCAAYIPVITRADKFRAMSDEELAEFLCDFRGCDTDENTCIGCKGEQYCRAGHAGTLEWLQQPAEVDHEQE